MIVDPFHKQKSAAKPNNLPWHCAVKKWTQQPHCWVHIYDSLRFSSTRSRNVWCDSGLEALLGCPSPPWAAGKQPPGPTGAPQVPCREWQDAHCLAEPCVSQMVLMGKSFVLGNRTAHISCVVFAKQKYFPADVMKYIWMSFPGKRFNSFQSCY